MEGAGGTGPGAGVVDEVALRTSSQDEPGWRRRRSGRGFSFVDDRGRVASGEERDRILALVIPPAWEDVWVCADPCGHLQAVGQDAAGRTQYLYHPQWRVERDREKFDRAQQFGSVLGRARARVRRDLALPGMPLERATAVAFRALDLGCLRVGSDVYAEENGSFGLTTLQRSHLTVSHGVVRCRFVGKSGVRQEIVLDDPELRAALETMRRRRADGEHLLAHRAPQGWRRVYPEDVNAYVRSVTGMEATAKDFRTWHATVVAAGALVGGRCGEAPGLEAAWEAAANLLGNTPTVARTSYVDPRVAWAHAAGRLVPRVSDQRRREREVLKLLATTDWE